MRLNQLTLNAFMIVSLVVSATTNVCFVYSCVKQDFSAWTSKTTSHSNPGVGIFGILVILHKYAFKETDFFTNKYILKKTSTLWGSDLWDTFSSFLVRYKVPSAKSGCY